MKTRAAELDVDFIGSQALLTKAEELALSHYFQSKKKIVRKVSISKQSIQKKTKVTVS